MNIKKCFIVIAAFTIAAGVDASSHPSAISPITAKLKLLQNQISIPGALTLQPALAKHAAFKTTDATLTRIESYSWNNSGWILDGNTQLTYDDRGRVIEWIDNSLEDESSYSKTTFEYDDALKLIRMLSYTRDSSEWYFSESIDITEYHFSDRQTFNTGFVTSFPLSLLDLSAMQSLAIDSTIYMYANRNQLTGEWDTTAHYKQIYNYSDTSIALTYKNYLDNDDLSELMDYEYIYRLDSYGRIDTMTERLLDTTRQQQQEFKIIYSYDNNRTESIKIIMSIYDAVDLYMEEKITISYLPSGRISSYLTEMRTSPDSAMRYFTKQEFIYTPSGIAAVRNNSPQSPASLTVSRGAYTITPPAGSVISEVIFFDLNGRKISTHTFAGTSTGQAVSLQLRTVAHSAHLMQVRTDRGTFNFAISGATAIRCR